MTIETGKDALYVNQRNWLDNFTEYIKCIVSISKKEGVFVIRKDFFSVWEDMKHLHLNQSVFTIIFSYNNTVFAYYKFAAKISPKGFLYQKYYLIKYIIS